MEDVFLRQLIAPFVAVLVFMLAHYIARVIVPWIPEGAVKHVLTKRRSTRCEFFERADERMFELLRSLWRKLRGQ